MPQCIIADKVIFDNEKNCLIDHHNRSNSVILPVAVGRCLEIFIRNQGEAVSKSELTYNGWGKFGVVVSEGSIWQAISQLRKTLSHFGLHEDIIITVPRLGYQFSSDIPIKSVKISSDSPCLPPSNVDLKFAKTLKSNSRAGVNKIKQAIKCVITAPVSLAFVCGIYIAVILMEFTQPSPNDAFHSDWLIFSPFDVNPTINEAYREVLGKDLFQDEPESTNSDMVENS